jgi:hypothetical protein
VSELFHDFGVPGHGEQVGQDDEALPRGEENQNKVQDDPEPFRLEGDNGCVGC